MARYCTSCGRSIPNDARVCPYCGKNMALHEGLMIPEQEQKKDKTVLIIVAVLIVLIVVPIAIAATVYVYVSGMLPEAVESSRYISLLEQENNTLVVTYVYPSYLIWSDVEVSSGIAMLPSGIISEGDTITNCDGVVTLRWESTNELIGTWIFS